ncbi:MAG: glutaredoxin family protein [Chloroflexi bacterium]|nr:glutaredoxin family protein [Chloroflexota bacterium]
MNERLITLYGRPGCELCDRSEALVRALIDARGSGHTLRLVNIEDDPRLHAQLLEQIPVLEVAGRRLPLALGSQQIARHLELS